MIASKVIFTHYTGDPHYRTPKDVYAQLDKEFHFTLDPAPFKSKTKNGLKKRWNGRVFVNPPYFDSTQWVEKAISERNENYRCKLVVMLLKGDIGTKLFHEIIIPNAKEIRAVKGRLKFGKNKKGKIDSAPFPSIIVIF